APPTGRHVLDGFFGFLAALGLHERVLDWSVPVPQSVQAAAARRLPEGPPWLLISPCSSHPRRDWLASRYAAVADHAAGALGMRVALIGGRSARERKAGKAIRAAASCEIHDLIGDAPLEMLLGLLQRGAALLTPDAGPAHMGNAAGIPVIGLHAATECARSGPYSSLRWCVDRYDAAARGFLKRPAAKLSWGTKIERRGVMELIAVADVIERLDAVMKQNPARTAGVSPACEQDGAVPSSQHPLTATASPDR
ncbi:MAG: hypothetical protein L0H19_05085, partial [Salinisphaera sp.]|nr:hypothetical protein [Salinisphaera sp.]